MGTGSSYGDRGNAIAVDGSGNVYVTGYSYASWGDPVNAFSQDSDAFAAKLDNSGVRLWNTFMGSSYYDDSGNAVAVDSSGNVYVAGESSSTWGSPILSGDGAFVVKLNSSGMRQWNTFMGSSVYSVANAIALDSSGDIYFAGESVGTWGSPFSSAVGLLNIFAAKLNNSGVRQWNTFMGSPEHDYGRAIAVDGSGNVYIAGDSDATWGSPVNAYMGDREAFVAKLSFPEMDVQGNSNSIDDGDTTPNAADLTDFGNAAVDGSIVIHTFSIENTGLNSLGLVGAPRVEISGAHAADFTLLDNPYSPVHTGNSTDFVIQFDPSAVGLREATISIANDDDDENPYDFSIQGTGTVAPEIDISGNSISISNGDTTPSTTDNTNFGFIALSSTSSHTFTIENTGTTDLNLSGTPVVEITGTHATDFTVTTQAATPIIASGSSTFTIEFEPSAAGLREAIVNIANDDSDESPYSFSLFRELAQFRT